MEFRIGRVTLNPSKQEKYIAPMAEFLAARLGYQESDTVYTKDIGDMVKKFELGEVDFFTGSFWEAAVLVNAGVGEPVAIKFKEQNENYRSLIMVRSDSDIYSIADLAGKLVAFEDPDSTSAFRIAYLHMQREGLKLEENIGRPTSDSVVHYRFSGAEQISSAWLYRNIVDALCMSDSDWNRADNVPAAQKNLYRIIYTSPALPRAVEVVRKSLPAETRLRLRQTLLDPGLASDQKIVLDQYHETSGFAEIDSETQKELENFVQYFSNLHTSNE